MQSVSVVKAGQAIEDYTNIIHAVQITLIQRLLYMTVRIVHEIVHKAQNSTIVHVATLYSATVQCSS